MLLLSALCSLAVLACVRGRRIGDPVPGAVQVVLQDSASVALAAFERAIVDEGVPIYVTDRDRSFVESQPIDVAALKTLGNPDGLSDAERVVRFRFYVRRDLGATRVFGEALYQLGGADLRAMQRMVPDDHPARQVLARMIEKAQRYLAESR